MNTKLGFWFKVGLIILISITISDLLLKLLFYYFPSAFIGEIFLFALTTIPRLVIVFLLTLFIFFTYLKLKTVLSKRFRYYIYIILFLSLCCFDIFGVVLISKIIDNTPLRRSILPKKFDKIKMVHEGYFKDNKTLVILSPDKSYKLIKYFNEPLMSFGSGATVIGVYDNKTNKLIGERIYVEEKFNSNVSWKSNNEIIFGNSKNSNTKLSYKYLKVSRKIKVIEYN